MAQVSFLQTFEECRQTYEPSVKAYILSLRDIRKAGILAFTIMVVLISWSGIKAIQTNYGLQKQVEQLKQENAIAQLENSNIQLENEYYKTSQYLEVAARQNFGLAKPGETVLLVPKSVAMKYVTPEAKDKNEVLLTQQVPWWQQNFRDWMNFFFHRTA